MKKLTLLLTAALLTSALPACSGKSEDKPTTIETKALPTIDMVATHDINLDFPVAQLTFVPNSVAPWLGRIILLDDAGRLYSTDIEGRDPKPVGSGKYIDIFGLAREAAPGVFLAITEDNKIEAFIESSDDGDFSPMIYSGADMKAQALCKSTEPVSNYATVLTTDSKFKALDISIQDTRMEYTITDSAKAPRQASTCVIDPINPKEYEFTLSNQTFNLSTNSSITGDMITNINIEDGLSVKGVKHIKFVTSTQSNYGGGAYAEGVLALVDKDENRIVFISLNYAERQLEKAFNSTNNDTEITPQ